ncbi:MAG: glycine zipper 2TM domain-containing protein [Sulfuricaulis sp.]|uniref:glycine zipper 2TM domain-containing protein n=1 Tax=Sulfuricaulis sp. TaxID=2003553 RepID=UPI0034A149FC
MRNFTVIILAATALLAGCAGGLGSGDYERGQTRGVQEVQMGVVESVREVKIEGTKTGIGSTAGAVVGGVAGSEVGGGKGQIIGGVLGAVVGGVAGAAVEEGTTRQPGIEVTVRLDSGRTIAVTQAADELFKVGERVRILSGSGVTRVTH